jgi:hypothetical protein
MFNRLLRVVSGTFTFLGFEFSRVKTCRGIDTVQLRTDSDRFRKAVGEFMQ